MADFPLQRFIDLVALDQMINNLERQIADFKIQVAQAEEQLTFYDTSLENIHTTTKEAKKRVDVLELELKTYDAQEKEKKARLASAENSVEYAALSREIDHLKKAQNEYEEDVLKAWREYEAAKKDDEEKSAKLKEQIVVLNAKIQDLLQKINHSSGQLHDIVTQRPLKQKDIPQEWLEKYDVMKKQVTNPVIVVQQDSCSACFYKISQQDLVELRKRKVLQCKDCYRFLYSDIFFDKEQGA